MPTGPGLDVSSGAEVDHVFEISTTRARVRVFASDGRTPLEGLRLFADGTEDRWSGDATTDPGGWAVFDHAPTGQIRLSAYPRNLFDDWAMAFAADLARERRIGLPS